MRKQKLTVKVKPKAPRTPIAQRPKVQEISRKKYKRSQDWKKEDPVT